MKNIMKVSILAYLLILSLNCIEKKSEPTDLDNIIVAEVGDEVLTRGELNEMILHAQQQAPPMYKNDITPELILTQWIDRKLISQEARRLGLDDSEEVKKKMLDYEDTLLIDELWKKEIEEKIELTEIEIKDYYDNARESSYKVNEEKVLFSLITVRAYTVAKEISERANAGEDFDKLEEEYDIEVDKPDYGSIYFRYSEIPSDLVDVVFNLKEGEASEPIKYSVGYVVLKLKDHIYPGEYIPFEVIKEQVKDRALQKKQQSAGKKYIEQLKAKTEIIKYLNKYYEAEKEIKKQEKEEEGKQKE